MENKVADETGASRRWKTSSTITTRISNWVWRRQRWTTWPNTWSPC